MTIVFRTVGAWGSGKGADLTPAEVDLNFWDHEGRIVALEGATPTPNGIASVEQTGSQLVFVLEDATTLDPVYMPVATMRPRGTWANATLYTTLDLVRSPLNGSLYICLVGHTSATSPDPFDPALEVGGEDAWGLLLDADDLGGGGGGGIPSDIEWVSTSSYTPVIGDIGKLKILDGTFGTQTISVPSDSVTDFPIGTTLYFAHFCATALHIDDDGSGVWVEPPDGKAYNPIVIPAYASFVAIQKVDDDYWIFAIGGELARDEEVGGANITTNITLAATHNGKHHTASGPITITIPNSSTYSAPIGYEAIITQISSGGGNEVTIDAAGGVTVYNELGAVPCDMGGLGFTVRIRYLGTNWWVIEGATV
jgi:hypothetical protein